MRFSIHQAQDHGVIRLAGRIGDDDGDGMTALLAAALEQPHQPWALDLAGVDAINDRCVAMLLALGGQATANQLRMAVVAPPDGPVADALAQAQLRHCLPVFPSFEAFLGECAPAALWAAHHPCAPAEHPLALTARQLTLKPAAAPDPKPAGSV